MSAAVAEHRLAKGASANIDDAFSDEQQPASRFTAVNGHSPTTNNSDESRAGYSAPTPSDDSSINLRSRETNGHAHHHHQYHHPPPPPPPPPPAPLNDASSSSQQQRSGSHSSASTGKRKHGNSRADSPGSVASHQSQKKRRATPPPPNAGYVQDHAAYATPRSEHADERLWHRHQRDGSSLSDAHLAEALQRESSQLGPHQSSSVNTSPEQRFSVVPSTNAGDSHLNQTSSADAGAGATGAGAATDAGTGDGDGDAATATSSSIPAQGQQKQRKRNFSNRTKTGCLTCRERKKKCDEGKPTCHNCTRGGFNCKGYSQSAPMYKHGLTREVVPAIQARNGFYDQASPYSFHPGAPVTGPPPPPSTQPAAGSQARLDFYDSHPPTTHPVHRSAEAAAVMAHRPMSGSEAERHHHQWSPEHYPNYPPEPVSAQYGEMPPINELTRHHKKLPPPNAVLHRSPPQQHQRNGSQSTPYSNTQITAQLALDASRAPPPPHPLYRSEQQFRTEKERMLNGWPYKPHDPQLKKDRQECAIAVHRFNKNAIDPTNLSESSKREQFRQILEPPGGGLANTDPELGGSSNVNGTSSNSASANGRMSSPADSNVAVPVGHLGSNVEVMAPFYCDYGYNICIGDDVDIGANCRIMDACSVYIGARTIIAPDVKILATDVDSETKRAKGVKRMLVGKKVVIGEDCFIGAGAIIRPGITIGDRVTVGAGTIVLKDVRAPHMVVNGLRMRLIRADYAEPAPRYDY